jgi:hypothetical protein
MMRMRDENTRIPQRKGTGDCEPAPFVAFCALLQQQAMPMCVGGWAARALTACLTA